MARDPLELAPGLPPGMAVGPQVAEAQPAGGRTIRGGTAVGWRSDGAPASSRAGDHGRRGSWCLGSGVGPVRTGCTSWWGDETGKGRGFFGTPASAWLGLERCVRHTGWVVGQPDMDEEAEQHKSNEQALVKYQGRRHDAVLFHGEERAPVYRFRPLLHSPLDRGTPPSSGFGLCPAKRDVSPNRLSPVLSGFLYTICVQ